VAFIALTPDGELAGVSRVSSDPDHRHGEYSLLVRSDMQGKGVGSALMQILIDYATADGLERLDGYVLADNRGMLGLISRFGFQTAIDREDPGVLTTWRDLSPDPRKSLDR
jgi:acetyltransferase